MSTAIALPGFWQSAFVWILVLAVSIGGTFPFLYGDVLPHEHFFLNSVPPADWEQHDHPSLAALLIDLSSAASGAVPSRAHRVISVYDGGSVIVLVMVTLVAMTLLAALVGLLPLSRRLLDTPLAPIPASPGEPPSPPPRSI